MTAKAFEWRPYNTPELSPSIDAELNSIFAAGAARALEHAIAELEAVMRDPRWQGHVHTQGHCIAILRRILESKP